MRGILFSVVLHTAVVLAVALGLPWLAKPPANASLNIAVDIVRLADITQPSKGEKPKPETDRKPDAERETTRKPVARDRQAAKPPPEPEPVRPKPPAPPKIAKPEPKPKPAPPVKTAVAKPAVKQKIAPPAPPKPAKKAEPAPKPKTAAPKRVEVDPRALQRQAGKPEKQAPAKKPEPPKTTPKPVAKPEKKPAKKPEKRLARPAPKPEKPKVARKKPEKPVKTAAKPKKKPEPKPPKAAREPAPKIERQVAALPRPRPPVKPRPKKSPKPPKKTAKNPPARKPATKDALDSVFKTVGKLKKSEQSDRDRTAARTQAGVRAASRNLPMTLSEIEAVRRQIRACWNFPTGAQGAGSLRVLIEIRLNRDGSLRGEPRVLDKARLGSDPRFRVAAEAGLRALNHPNCSPLRLPPEKFDRWKELTIDFDPSKLSSG